MPLIDVEDCNMCDGTGIVLVTPHDNHATRNELCQCVRDILRAARSIDTANRLAIRPGTCGTVELTAADKRKKRGPRCGSCGAPMSTDKLAWCSACRSGDEPPVTW